MKKIRKNKLTNYFYIHKWNYENHPKSGICIHCGVKDKKTEYALIHGKGHERGISNYLELCKKCHIAYDKTKEWDKRKLNSLSKTYSHLNPVKTITCKQCNKWFIPRRKTTKYCSNSCSAKGEIKWKILVINKK